MDQDYLLKVKVQNNRIISLMRQKGIANVAELARQVKIARGVIDDLVNMTVTPFGNSSFSDGLWRKSVIKLADFFGVLPEEMFNEQQLNQPLLTNVAEKAISQEAVVALMGPAALMLPEQEREQDEKLELLYEGLEDLHPREKDIIMSYFGLDGDKSNFEEIGKKYGVSRTRAMQIKDKALRKLRHNNDELKTLVVVEEPEEDNGVVFTISHDHQKLLCASTHPLKLAKELGLHIPSVRRFFKDHKKYLKLSKKGEMYYDEITQCWEPHIQR